MNKENTIPELFQNRVKNYGDKVVMRFKKQNSYKNITWRELDQMVKHFSLCLISLGVKMGECVVLLSENRPEWVCCDLAILSIGSINVTLLPSCGWGNIKYIKEECKAKIIIISNDKQLHKILIEKNTFEKIIILDIIDNNRCNNIISFKECLSIGENLAKVNIDSLLTRMADIDTEDTASIIYNINSTGKFSGIMLTHRNFLSNSKSFAKSIPVTEDDISFHFCSFSYVFGRICGYYLILQQGGMITFTDFPRLDKLSEINATIAFANPRVYQGMYKMILNKLQKFPYVKRKLLLWAINKKERYDNFRLLKKIPPLMLFIYFIIAKILISSSKYIKQIKKILGTSLRFFVSGGAPLSRKVLDFFYSIIEKPILEGYGLTEALIVSVNKLEHFKLGTVGEPLSEIEVKIAEDNEILVRGPNVTKGYYNCPDETRKIINNRWLSTKDIGYLDSDNFLTITGLKKDIIINSAGINISPTMIEELLEEDEYIKDTIVYGDGKEYLTALIVPNFRYFRDNSLIDKFLYQNNTVIVNNPKVKEFFYQRIKKRLSHLSMYEQIKDFILINDDFDINFGSKNTGINKRLTIYKKYKNLIETMYKKV
ncbi:MAG: hypothetical protein AMJ95_01105 [Omnitrophica WOR_2 bacterium SM23_72]|nr:MAG: hypothetical protein AMJ95_01105 [Omnitrophica WOR_2 bacterium SM23_72]